MKYNTKYIYVDLETGEVEEHYRVKEEEKDKRILIIKTEKNTYYEKANASRTTKLTKYYRRNKYTQATLY